MKLREEIEASIGPAAFDRPTFYANPGGLRFELSEGGPAVVQFLTSLRKAREVCENVFRPQDGITACLSVYLYRPVFAYRDSLRDLRRAGVAVSRERSIWLVTEDDEVEPLRALFIAFRADRAMLSSLLWCALSVDLGIQPCPRLRALYLVNLEQGVLVHPYDDRGMDVVGSNHELLSRLYAKHGNYLLDYDRKAMAATFDG